MAHSEDMAQNTMRSPVHGPRIVLGLDYGTTFTGKPVYQAKTSFARLVLQLLPQGWLGYKQMARVTLH
jgi:hypothetical protein